MGSFFRLAERELYHSFWAVASAIWALATALPFHIEKALASIWYKSA